MTASALVVAASPVTVTVLPKAVVQVMLGNQQPTVKVGNKVEILVNLQRLAGYADELKAELVLPPGTKGIRAESITIPADQTSGKLVIAVAPDAAVGQRPNLTVRVVALFDGTVVINHDKKLTVNVVK